MPLSTEVGLSTGDIVLDGESAPPKKGHSLHFSVHVYCVQTAGWIKMPLGTKIGFGPGHIVLNGDPFPQRWHSPLPTFLPMSIVVKRSPVSATAEYLFYIMLFALCKKCSAVAEMADRLATIDMGRRVRGCCAPFGGGVAGSPSNTVWPGPIWPSSIPSGVLIHPAV